MDFICGKNTEKLILQKINDHIIEYDHFYIITRNNPINYDFQSKFDDNLYYNPYRKQTWNVSEFIKINECPHKSFIIFRSDIELDRCVFEKSNKVKIIIEKDLLDEKDLIFPFHKKFYLNKEEDDAINEHNLDVILKYKTQIYVNKYKRTMKFLKEYDFIYEPNENKVPYRCYNNYDSDVDSVDYDELYYDDL